MTIRFRNLDWLIENGERPLAEYRPVWVAVRDDRIVATAQTLREVVASLNKTGETEALLIQPLHEPAG